MNDRDIYTAQRFGQRMGFGASPALLIIDFMQAYTDEAQFGGFNINDAIEATSRLLGMVREAGLPVAHVRFGASADGADLGSWVLKIPNLAKLVHDQPSTQFVPAVAPVAGEWVAVKKHSSAFFGTPLTAFLASRGVDTLIVTGCTTSGCVRASVVDASAHGYRVIVPEECSGDRAEGPHRANLFDMEQKYADVMPLARVMTEVAAHRRMRASGGSGS
jgi:maleamate amidohydrolase